jgi:hypothetical protein
MTLEINKVEGSGAPGCVSPGLNAPGGGQPCAIRELDVGGRPNENRVPGKRVQTDALVLCANSAPRRLALGKSPDGPAPLPRMPRRPWPPAPPSQSPRNASIPVDTAG